MTQPKSITRTELLQAFKKQPIHWLSMVFGSGLMPKAPGTFGTLATIPLIVLTASQSLLVKLIILVLVSVLGIWICGKSAELLGEHDHGSIVWDELAGFYLTMIFIPFSWAGLVVGFVLFRLFDIIKPWPIKQLDAQVHGGLGIMLDDIIAGLFAGGLLFLFNYYNFLNIL